MRARTRVRYIVFLYTQTLHIQTHTQHKTYDAISWRWPEKREAVERRAFSQGATAFYFGVCTHRHTHTCACSRSLIHARMWRVDRRAYARRQRQRQRREVSARTLVHMSSRSSSSQRSGVGNVYFFGAQLDDVSPSLQACVRACVPACRDAFLFLSYCIEHR